MDFEKGNRYYRIVLHQDLWDSWIVTRIWGSKGKKAQYCRHEPHLSFEVALQRLQELAFYRERKRHYVRLPHGLNPTEMK